MAGDGTRFSKAGYTLPKPLVNVNGLPMISRVIRNLDVLGVTEYIFLVRAEHWEKYSLLRTTIANETKGRSTVVKVDKLTEGAACTALLAKDIINSFEDLLIANSDQLIDFDLHNFSVIKDYTSADGIIFTFKDTNPKWSFVKLKELEVVEVAEKNPISDNATCGVYWFRRGYNFVDAAEQMIAANVRTNNEFYIAPVYNFLIHDNKTILPFFVNKMHGIGTPEDLNEYLRTLSVQSGIV